MFSCSNVLLFACSLVLLFSCSLVLLFHCSNVLLFKVQRNHLKYPFCNPHIFIDAYSYHGKTAEVSWHLGEWHKRDLLAENQLSGGVEYFEQGFFACRFWAAYGYGFARNPDIAIGSLRFVNSGCAKLEKETLFGICWLVGKGVGWLLPEVD